jgi:hypothetical protein
MTVRLMAILFGCVCLVYITPTTHAFADLGELNVIIEYFLDLFHEHGGRELLELLARGETVNIEDFEELDAVFGLPCLLGAIRSNRHAKEAAAIKCYDEISVCLSDQEGLAECPKENNELIQFTDKLDASGKEFRFANDEGSLPPNLQGAFWLNYALVGSSIMNFAKTRDGGDLSTGIFESDTENISYRIRVAGDRNWAYEVNAIASAYGLGRIFDAIYEFKMTEGTNEDPKRMTVFLSFVHPLFPMFRIHLRECFEWCKLDHGWRQVPSVVEAPLTLRKACSSHVLTSFSVLCLLRSMKYSSMILV